MIGIGVRQHPNAVTVQQKKKQKTNSIQLNMKDITDMDFHQPRVIISTKSSRPNSMVTQRCFLRKNNTRGKIQGSFVEPKQLIMSEYKMLIPSKKSVPLVSTFNQHEVLPLNNDLEHVDEVQIPDIDQTNIHTSSLGFILNKKIEEPKFSVDQIDRMLGQIPQDWHEIGDYVETIKTKEQPTNALIEIAEMMRKRRHKLYKDLKTD